MCFLLRGSCVCVCFSLPRSQVVCGLAGLMCDVLCLELLGMMLEIPSGWLITSYNMIPSFFGVFYFEGGKGKYLWRGSWGETSPVLSCSHTHTCADTHTHTHTPTDRSQTPVLSGCGRKSPSMRRPVIAKGRLRPLKTKVQEEVQEELQEMEKNDGTKQIEKDISYVESWPTVFISRYSLAVNKFVDIVSPRFVSSMSDAQRRPLPFAYIYMSYLQGAPYLSGEDLFISFSEIHGGICSLPTDPE